MIETAVDFLFLALSIASIYLLVAIGLSIVFGSLKFVNMAHGVLYLAGAYIGLIIGYDLTFGGLLGDIGLGMGFTAALILTPIIVFFIGIAMERTIAKPFYGRDLLDQLLVTFGILLIVQELFVILFGGTGRLYSRPAWARGSIGNHIPSILLPPGLEGAASIRVYMVFLTFVFVGLIFAFYRYTDYGLAVRAGTEDTEMTEMLGIRIGRPFLLLFAIGAAYAGLAGVLGGSLFNVTPWIGVEVIIPALVIVIMGGVGSIRGTVLASLLAGLTYAAVVYGPIVPSTFARTSIYVLAVVVLAIRPSGIYPTAEIGQ